MLIPNKWLMASLGEVFFTTSGGTPSRNNKEYYNGTIPWIKSGELDRGIIKDSEEKISFEAVKNSSAKIFPSGTLLIALYGATIGKLAFLGTDAATNQAICGVFQHQFIESKFCYYFLLYSRPVLVKQGIGGAQPNISQTILKSLDFPLPPLPIQRAIVARIEELFSELDHGIADLKKAQAQLKVYRQAVLKKAFEGEWKIKTLNDVAKWGSGGTPSRQNSQYYQGQIPWLKTGELGSKYVYDAEEKISEEAIKKSSAKLFPKGSVGIAMYGATIGKTSIFGADLTTNQACAVAQPNPELFNEYLYYFLLSQKNDFIKQGIGGAQPNISQTILKVHPIPVPSMIDQKQIVKEIESRLSVCDSIEQTITESLSKSEALRQSILKKAFEGKLLTQEEITRCEQESDYEPASVLLERIKQEKRK